MDLRRLRRLTILVPLGYLLAVEILSIFVLHQLIRAAIPRLIVIFAILTLGAITFSFWVFNTIERQQRDLLIGEKILESVKDYAIFMLDPEGRVKTWSVGAQRIKGYRAPEIIGRHISVFYPSEDVETGKPRRNLELAATHGQFEDEGWRVRKDGSLFWANVLSTVVPDEKGNIIGFTHVVRDETERQEARGRIQQLNTELVERVRHLATASDEILRRNKELGAVNEAISSISAALDLSEVLQNIIDAARDLVHSRYGALGISDENGRIVKFITSGITQEQRTAIGPLPEGHGFLGQLIQKAEPLRIRDISKEPNKHGFPPNHPPMTSFLGVPIVYQDQAIGDLYLTEKIGAEEFSRQDQELLTLLARHAGVAIENARLYEEVRAARDRLQAWSGELESKVAERTHEIQKHSRELTTRVLEAQEEERKRIARELHDETAQSLSTLLIDLDLLEPQIPENGDSLRTGFGRIRELAKRTLDETRALSHDLRPTILDDFGLVAAIHWYADEFKQNFNVPVDVEIDSKAPERLAPELEVALFRIAQEALNNSGKHACATQTRVKLDFPAHAAQLVVEDDGRGFNPEEIAGPTRQGGLGLYGMRERAVLVGAKLLIESEPGKGTKVTVLAPLSYGRREMLPGQEEKGSKEVSQ